ncbi:hypothetical protein [Piscinibacter sp.]|uniref:hypothetical protein n=1 Tax=Piscinibacter sp. TaxID=1903157 RepID=UPI002B8222A6|nr:hypothetical protein [Albitalea sp.]HUG26289.1 hypothetical protein [Albitalea sp.]
MSTLIRPFIPSSRSPVLGRLGGLAAELLARERRLTLYGGLLLALLLPMAIAWGVDDRMLRGANVWLKPMKFSFSIAVLALTTAWFVGHLPAERRRGRAVDRIVWLLIGAGTFELSYITLQAGLGQGSHYNVGDMLHGAMYTLMGIGALLLTVTQPILAWQLARHPDPQRPAAYRHAVLIGLVLTFVFGAVVGGLLSSMQPPSGGATLPMLGWALSGGDLRPAHFVGIHAEQVLPVVGFAAATLSGWRAKTAVWAAAAGYALLFALLVAWGLSGGS